MEAQGHLALMVGRLGAEPEHGGTKRGELAMTIAKGVGLRRAAASAWNEVPAVRQLLSGMPVIG
jgi:hypothetical protein